MFKGLSQGCLTSSPTSDCAFSLEYFELQQELHHIYLHDILDHLIIFVLISARIMLTIRIEMRPMFGLDVDSPTN